MKPQARLHMLIGLMLLFPLSGFAEKKPSICEFWLGKPTLDIRLEENTYPPRLQVFNENTWFGKVLNQVANIFRKPLRLNELAEVMYSLQGWMPHTPYFPQLAGAFQLQAELDGLPLTSIPKDRPIVFYGNHPLAAAEAFAFLSEVQKHVRTDVVLVAANFLAGVPGFKENAFIVNKAGTEQAKWANKVTIGAMISHLQHNKAFLIYPSGEVSATREGPHIVDQAWRGGFIKSAKKNPSTLLIPVFTHGQPSDRYLNMKEKSVAISNALVFAELADQIGQTIKMTIGTPITLDELKPFASAEEEEVKFLRERLYALRPKPSK